jgi:hypothetical protein
MNNPMGALCVPQLHAILRALVMRKKPMSYLHDPNNPRHARLFELLYQSDMADVTALHAQNLKVRPVDKDELDVIRRIAERSMTRMN